VILVDSCILLDLATRDPLWFEWSLEKLTHFGSFDTLVYNPVIYAEVGVKETDRAALDERFSGWHFEPFDREVAWRAARAHAAYRAKGGNRERVLGDFWIGAQAAARNWKLLTRNPADFKTFQIGSLLVHP